MNPLKWGFFTMKRFFLYILLIFLLFSVYFIGNIYRPYVFDNNINDFGLADVGYNPIAVTNMAILRWLGFYKLTSNKVLDIFINTFILISFEILSFFFNIFGVFDLKDIIALLFSLLFSLILFCKLDSKVFRIQLLKILFIIRKFEK